MDRHELTLMLIENPELFSLSELEKVFQNQETRDFYNLTVKINMAMMQPKKVDVDHEWDNFIKCKQNGILNRMLDFKWLNQRAASIMIIVLTSMMVIAAGIFVTISLPKHENVETDTVSSSRAIGAPIENSINSEVESAPVNIPVPILFEDVSLKEIMDSISSIYKKDIMFLNRNTPDLHLYFKLDPSLSLEAVVSQLNTFDHISITEREGTLIIE